MSIARPAKWTRHDLLIALNLYCKLPFGKFHAKNPIIIETATKMGRTPSSLAMKLCNFASLDPVQQARGINGLPGVSRQDREIWHWFFSDTKDSIIESEQLMHDLFSKDESKALDLLTRDVEKFIEPEGPTEVEATLKVRRGQQFFRQAVLTAYDTQCCISGINVPRLLVASHIKPWRSFPDERLNLRNGLCLSNLHDAAFDSGLIALDAGKRVLLSKKLRSFFPQASLEQNFVPFEGKQIRVPEKLAEPDPGFLEFHRENIFQR